MTGSWMMGPRAALPRSVDGSEDLYRGERLGLPADGPGSLASTGRRAAAMVLDVLSAASVAALFTAPAAPRNWSLLVWIVVGVVSVALFSFTPGQAAMGVRVVRVDARASVGLVRALTRVAMVFLIVPAVVTDLDGRGVQDRATGTAVVRSR